MATEPKPASGVELQLEEDTAAGIAPADLKIILLGDSAAGKSKLLTRFLEDQYNPRTRSTFALTLYRYDAELTTDDAGAAVEVSSASSAGAGAGGAPAPVEGAAGGRKRRVAVDFWDTAGQERFASMHASYYYKAHACILVFDVTRKVTYTNLTNWYAELRRYCATIPCFVVANKIDVDYSVTSKSFAFATKNGLPLHYVSAADGTNVVAVFHEAIKAGWAYKHGEKDFVAEVLELLGETDAPAGAGGVLSVAGAGAAASVPRPLPPAGTAAGSASGGAGGR